MKHRNKIIERENCKVKSAIMEGVTTKTNVIASTEEVRKHQVRKFKSASGSKEIKQ